MEQIILVDEQDNEIGREEKIKAHLDCGKLHRAFSVVIFDSDPFIAGNPSDSTAVKKVVANSKINLHSKILIQKRAAAKYHCPGIWANTCCSHPRPDEEIIDAAYRRVREEMGFDCLENGIELKEIFAFTYRQEFDNGLTEHEFDHIFFGIAGNDFVSKSIIACKDEKTENNDKNNNPIKPNPNEVEELKWMSIKDLIIDIKQYPDKYAVWFKLIIENLNH
ncbi:MAG: isopentenyl-diphosphate delta-isomerase [Candidatus Woesearchaeota archaeon]